MTTRALLGACVLATLAACGDLSDNVSWVVVSNPGGSSFDGRSAGGAVIVIRDTSVGNLLAAHAASARVFSLHGADARGEVTVHLPLASDAVVMERPGRVEIGSPWLEPRMLDVAAGRLRLATGGALALTIEGVDAARLDQQSTGPAALHLAATGNLWILQTATSIVVWDSARPNPERFDAPLGLDLDGEHAVVTSADGRLRVLFPPPPPIDTSRVAAASDARSLRVFGPIGQVVAVLPRDRVTLHGDGGATFLSASFPDGLIPGESPMSLMMTRHNRYLLQVQAPR